MNAVNRQATRVAQLALALAISLAISLSTAMAQDPTKAKTYVPEGYDSELRIDMDALIDSGAWDVIERSLARVAIEKFRRQHGFAMTDLKVIRRVGKSSQEGKTPINGKAVMIYQGNRSVSLEKAKMQVLLYTQQEEEIDSHVLIFNDYEAYTSPRAGLVISGNPDLLREGLMGEKPAGMPCDELLRITVGKRHIFEASWILHEGWTDDEMTRLMIPKDWFRKDEDPSALQVTMRGDKDSDHLHAELRFRFAKAGKGPEQLAKGVKAMFKGLIEDKKLKTLKALFANIVVEVDDSDLWLRLDLGEEGKDLAKLTHLYFHLAATMNLKLNRQR